MQVLSDLWYGNIAPHERTIPRNSEYRKLLQKLVDHGDQIRNAFTPELKMIFDEYESIYTTINAKNEEEAFITGFRLGAKMILDVLEECHSV